MAEPELAFSRKTTDDVFGRHALVYVDDSGFPAEGRRDVNHMMPHGSSFHPTRMPEGYQPKHAVAERNSTNNQEVL